MKEFISELFFHFFIMMIIPLAFILLFRQGTTRKMNVLFFLIICVSLLVSMLFPVKITDGIKFDFKFIPIFIAFFYIGPISGLMAICALFVSSLFINISTVLQNLINYASITLIFFIVYKHFIRKNLLFKLFTGVVCYLFIFLTRTMYLFQSGQMDAFFYLVLFSIVSIITLSATIYLIEMNKLQLLMMEQLKKADKFNAINQLAASIAHEIRNPMTTIRGFLQLMKNESNLTSNQGMFISLSLEELDRTNEIINDFLSLARPTCQFNDSIPLSTIIIDIVDFMKPYAVMSNVKINVNLEDSLYVEGNVNECKQLLINLIKNGIEAMPDGGKLDVFAYKRNDNVILEIIDDGIGLSALQLEQIGQPYYSTKTKGTGLGLMISFDIIKRMKGKYEIQSIEKQGTSFKLSFPFKNITLEM